MGSAAGVMKASARRVGLTVDDYLARRAAGKKRCIRCQEWKMRDDFHCDASRGDGRAAQCIVCKSGFYRAAYTPVPDELRRPYGPDRIERRCGDKMQARSRINHDVTHGLRPDPNSLHCAVCGHKGPDRRHEYHHHMGYGAAHHYDVLPLCAPCHHAEHPRG